MSALQSKSRVVSSGNLIPAALCFFGALIEGFDISSAGLTARKFADFYGMDHLQLGTAFSASTLGMLVGALLGGWLADRVDRKLILSGAFALFGGLTLATTAAPDAAAFIVLRVMTGIGLGSAIVSLIAMAAALGPEETRATRVTVLFSGIAFGGMAVSLLSAFLPSDYDWRLIFAVGGVIPLTLGLLFHLKMPHVIAAREASPTTPGELFTEGRAIITICLWVMCFATLLTLHLMLNWLPSLVVDFGRTAREGALVTASFNFGGGVSGSVLAYLIMTKSIRTVFISCYCGIIVGMAVMLVSAGFLPLMFLGSLVVGFCLNGAQFLIYGVGASLYRSDMVGTGMGFATGVGRLGSMAGPMLGGLTLAAGGGALGVLVSTLPPIGAALTASIVLLSGRRSAAKAG